MVTRRLDPTPAPFDRELRRGNRLAATWLLRRRAAATLPADLPQPAPREVLGTDGWEGFRAADLARRRPGAVFPALPAVPTPRLSPSGRTWAAAVRTTLHLRLEDELLADPRGFAAVEASPAALLEHARRALPEVCLEAGMIELPVEDLAALCGDPEAGEPLATVASVVLIVRGQARTDARWWEAVDEAAVAGGAS
jgi:hypothetical protein